MQEPIWRTHPEYANYEISSDGRVRSIDRFVGTRWGGTVWRAGRELKTFVRKGGYLGGNISVDNIRINFEVHVFVCETFHGPRPSDELEVRHLNGNQLDNRPANLAWGTRVENARDIIHHGRNHELNKTHCRNGHAFSEDNIYRAPSSPNKRKCRKCQAIAESKRVRTWSRR